MNLMLGLINNTLNFSATYSREVDVIHWRTFTHPNSNIIYTKPVNVRPYNNYALRMEFNKRWFGAWSFKAVARLALNTENDTFGEATYSNTRLRQYYSVVNSLNLDKGWGGSADFYIEPTFHDFDRTYHTVWQLNLRIYKTFMNHYLQIIADCKPFERRRILDRHTDTTDIRLQYSTPHLTASIKVVWYFKGGQKDIKVKINQPSLDYEEMRGN